MAPTQKILYSTVSAPIENTLVIEKSKFIAQLRPVQSEAEIQSFFAEIRKKHWDATHNCTAWILSDDLCRSNDDGEPGGTAGKPMLEALRRKGLTRVAAVVTRYFGGIKLGAGGLVRAYGQAVQDAIAEAGVTDIVEKETLALDVPYSLWNRVEAEIQSRSLQVLDTTWAEHVSVLLALHAPDIQPLQFKLHEMSSGALTLQPRGTLCVPQPRRSGG